MARIERVVYNKSREDYNSMNSTCARPWSAVRRCPALRTLTSRSVRALLAGFCFSVLFSGNLTHVAFAAQSKGYGPEIKSFLEYVRHEETELNFQIEHKEIARKDYVRSKARLEILKEAVLNRARQTGQDLVPEYHVVAADEVEELIPGGTDALKGVKPGDVVLTRWKYIGNTVRGEKFFILERIVEN
jgi:hypothetical protein